jgi:hypothetical protein
MTNVKSYLKRTLPDWLIAIRRHRKIHGQFPNLIHPQTFNEKILHRMLFDRRSLLIQMADKAAARSYIESCLGPQRLPDLYYVTTRPETIPFAELPNCFVVKPTHGSGWVQIVTDKTSLDCTALIDTCTRWLNQNFYDITLEWVYKYIKPRIMVEQFIDDGRGAIPNDYKVFVFDGSVEIIQVDSERFTSHKRRFYSPAWEKLDVLFEYEDIAGDIPKPTHLVEMIDAAKTLGRGLDFIRADFYETPDRLYCGELTTTPGCGLNRFHPKEFDRYLGSRWKLPEQCLFAQVRHLLQKA